MITTTHDNINRRDVAQFDNWTIPGDKGAFYLIADRLGMRENRDHQILSDGKIVVPQETLREELAVLHLVFGGSRFLLHPNCNPNAHFICLQRPR